MKRLEQEEAVEGCQANLSRKMLGYDITAFVQVTFSVHTDDTPNQFELAVQEIPEILSCCNGTGEADYLLWTTPRSLPGVSLLKTSLSLRKIKGTEKFPLKG